MPPLGGQRTKQPRGDYSAGALNGI